MGDFLLSGFADEISPDFEYQMEALNRLGLHYMEIRGVDKVGVDKCSAEMVRELKKRLDFHGIGISSLASPIGKIELSQDFSQHLEHFKHVVELAHILNTPYIRIFSFFIPDGTCPEDHQIQVFERLGALVKYASSETVVLLHENEKNIYGDSIKRCKELMDEFYGNNFRAVFDFANFIQCGENVEAAYETLKPFIEYVHIKDARISDGMIVPAGEGDGKIREILHKLKASGYRGFLSLEPHLTEFEGLKNLEKDGVSIQGMQKRDGEEAFTIALRALQKILYSL